MASTRSTKLVVGLWGGLFLRLGVVADEQVDFCRPENSRIDHDMVLTAQANRPKCELTELSGTTRLGL